MPNLKKFRTVKRVTTSQQWITIGAQRFYSRSKWERNYARYLQWLKENNEIRDWEYEPQTFWFEGIRRGANNYRPDFYVNVELCPGGSYYAEVKGYMDPKSLTKIKRFRKFFPNLQLIVIDSKWFKQNSSKLKLFIKDWE